MGAKNSILVFTDGDAREALRTAKRPDAAATLELVQQLFPGAVPRPEENTSLVHGYPPGGTVRAACYPGVSIVAAEDFAIDFPSKMPAQYLAPGTAGTVYLHVMHSVVDWCAFAVWKQGKLQRSLSATPESGDPARAIHEDTGERLPFELPYWQGQHPLLDADDEEAGGDDYPLPFHPLDLGEAALFEFLGYQLEGDAAALFQPEDVPLLSFAKRPWWKFW